MDSDLRIEGLSAYSIRNAIGYPEELPLHLDSGVKATDRDEAISVLERHEIQLTKGSVFEAGIPTPVLQAMLLLAHAVAPSRQRIMQDRTLWRTARELAGFSQARAAALLDINASTMNRWESGRRTPSNDTGARDLMIRWIQSALASYAWSIEFVLLSRVLYTRRELRTATDREAWLAAATVQDVPSIAEAYAKISSQPRWRWHPEPLFEWEDFGQPFTPPTPTVSTVRGPIFGDPEQRERNRLAALGPRTPTGRPSKPQRARLDRDARRKYGMPDGAKEKARDEPGIWRDPKG